MSSLNNTINSLSTLGALTPEVVNYDSSQFAKLTPGYLLGEFENYRLKQQLGSGGMGQTWLAEELAGGEIVQNVVVKVLTRELCGNAEALAEVRRVFELTGKLRHSNICATLGMKKDPVFGWILVMDYLEGGTLADWFQGQPNHEKGLPLEEILPILRPIAEALDYAHGEGILHRDVKPQNIMFSNAKPILIDFGIAARIRPESIAQIIPSDEDSSTEHVSSTSGTPVYMAPEQMRGLPQTGRADQYALAMVLWELLAGNLPLKSKNFTEIACQKVLSCPDFSNFPHSVNLALSKALSPDPENRFATCKEFLDALSGVVVPAEDSSSPAKNFRGKRGGFSICLIAVGLAFWGILHFNGETSQLEVELEKGKVPVPEVVGKEKVPEAPEAKFGKEKAPEEEFGKEKVPEVSSFPVREAGERIVKLADGIEYSFRWCPGGTFVMGEKDEAREVMITEGFWMLETEVTQAMWQSVMGENPSAFPGALNPVERVAWDDCQLFCAKLSEKLGVTVSLPSGAQWEYACRAGKNGDSENLAEMGWYGEHWQTGSTHPVRQKQANAWGLYDMYGNVAEWCMDSYEAQDTNSEAPQTVQKRVARGGGWCGTPGHCRSTLKVTFLPDYLDSTLGFRIVMAAQE